MPLGQFNQKSQLTPIHIFFNRRGAFVAIREHPSRDMGRSANEKVDGRARVYFSNGKTVFQSFFMSTSVQPFAPASSSALSSCPIFEGRS
jgi:hypothetical protein